MGRMQDFRERAKQRRAEYAADIAILGDVGAYGDPGDDVVFGVDANGLSPGQSGYDPTTDPASPSYVDPNAVTDTTISAPDASYDPTPVPAPPLNTTIQVVPSDGVVYDGSKGMPPYCVASYNYWKGTPPEDTGFVWGFDKIAFPNSGNPPRWIKVTGKRGVKADTDAGSVVLNILTAGAYGGVQAAASKDNWNWQDVGAGDLPDPAAASAAAGYGPLIGNPSMPDFNNLRYAVADKKWFWYPTEAPDWSTAEAKRQIALLNQQTAKTLADAAAAQKVLDDQAAQDLANAQAAQDAADAKSQHDQDAAQQAADAAAQVAATAQQQEEAASQSKIDQQQAVIDQQQAQQQAQLDMQAAQAQQQLDVQQQQMQMQAAQADLDYAKAHPEEAHAQAVQQQQQEAAPPDRGTTEEESAATPSDRGTSEDDSSSSDEQPAFEGEVLGAARAVDRLRAHKYYR